MSETSKPTTRRAAARPRALKAGDENYDAQAGRELKRRTKRLKKLAVEADELIWRQGLELLVIRDKRLYLQEGHETFIKWVQNGLKRSRDFVYDRIHVAEAYVLHHIRRYGLDLLEQGSRYARLTATEDDRDWSPDSLVLSVPDRDRVREIPFRKASPADIEAAIAHQLRLLADREKRAIPAAAANAAEHLRSALQVPQSSRTLADVRVRAGDTGLVEDTRLSLSLRYGDLRSVILQLARAILGSADPARGRP